MEKTEDQYLEDKKRFAIGDAIWAIVEDSTSGLFAKLNWEDCTNLGDRLYELGYRRQENES